MKPNHRRDDLHKQALRAKHFQIGSRNSTSHKPAPSAASPGINIVIARLNVLLPEWRMGAMLSHPASSLVVVGLLTWLVSHLHVPELAKSAVKAAFVPTQNFEQC